jgi:hypothetical protein
MKTLEDLRTSLAGHAEAITDDALIGRNAALRDRIRRARTRRRAGVAGGLAAAVLVAAGVVAGIVAPSHRTVAPVIAGHALQSRVTVQGFGYALAQTAQGRPGQTTLRLQLPEVDRDRVVSLVASGLGGGRATLQQSTDAGDDGGGLERIVADSAVGGPVPVDTSKETLVVRVSGAPGTAVVGLAVYGRDDTMPPGVLSPDRSTVFRQSIGSAHLVGGAFAAPGADSVTMSVEGDPSHWGLQVLCEIPLQGRRVPQGWSSHHWLRVSIDGQPAWAESCGGLTAGEPGDEDAAHGVVDVDPQLWGPGTEHTVTISTGASSRDKDPAEPFDGAVIGMAAYDVPATSPVGGGSAPLVQEYEGRDWTVDHVYSSHGWAKAFGRTLVVGDQPVALGVSARTRGSVQVTVDVAGTGRQVFAQGQDGGIGGFATVLLPGESYDVSVAATALDGDASTPTKPFRGSIVVYRIAD